MHTHTLTLAYMLHKHPHTYSCAIHTNREALWLHNSLSRWWDAENVLFDVFFYTLICILPHQQAGPGFRIEIVVAQRLKKISECVSFCKFAWDKMSILSARITTCTSADLCVIVHAAASELTGLVDVAQQLGDFDEASHRALRLLLQPLVVLPEALHLSL